MNGVRIAPTFHGGELPDLAPRSLPSVATVEGLVGDGAVDVLVSRDVDRRHAGLEQRQERRPGALLRRGGNGALPSWQSASLCFEVVELALESCDPRISSLKAGRVGIVGRPASDCGKEALGPVTHDWDLREKG